MTERRDALSIAFQRSWLSGSLGRSRLCCSDKQKRQFSLNDFVSKRRVGASPKPYRFLQRFHPETVWEQSEERTFTKEKTNLS
jgi:ribosome modulation factor